MGDLRGCYAPGRLRIPRFVFRAISALKSSLVAACFWALVGFLQVFTGFFQSAEGVVVGLQGLAILAHGALALAGDVEDFSQLDAAPDFRPTRIAIAVNRGAIGIGRRLIIPLQEEDFSDPVMRQRAVFVEVEGFVELRERAREIALLLHGLSS